MITENTLIFIENKDEFINENDFLNSTLKWQ